MRMEARTRGCLAVVRRHPNRTDSGGADSVYLEQQFLEGETGFEHCRCALELPARLRVVLHSCRLGLKRGGGQEEKARH